MSRNWLDDLDVFQSRKTEKRRNVFRQRRIPMQASQQAPIVYIIQKGRSGNKTKREPKSDFQRAIKNTREAIKFGRKAYAFGAPIAQRSGRFTYAKSQAGIARLKAYIESKKKIKEVGTANYGKATPQILKKDSINFYKE